MFESIKEQILGLVTRLTLFIKKQLLGSNNERIDFIMDSFYKLPPNYQNVALLSIVGSVAFVIMIIFSIYFSQVGKLERELSDGFDALQKLRVMAQDFNSENERMDWLIKNVETKSNSLRPKPFLEEKANQLGLVLEGLKSEDGEIPQDNPLSSHFTYINIDFRVPKISIPRMLKFFEEIEKADKGLSIKNLQVRARYGDKLYFDIGARIVGLKVRSKS